MNYRLIYYLSLVLILFSCESEFDKYYNVDQGDGETIYNVLEAREGFEIFTKALSAAGYEKTLASSGLFTVLAVEDDAFVPYLSSYGISTDELTNPSTLSAEKVRSLQEIMGTHILDWSYTVTYLTAAFKKENAPLDANHFRRLSRCQPAIIEDETYDSDGNFDISGIEAGNINDGDPIRVIPHRKLNPFFSQDFLNELEITQNDIDYFFPNVTSDLASGDVVTSSAKIIEADISALNGWIQVIDAGLSYQPNLYEVLQENKSNYSTVLSMVDRFATYVYDATFTERYGEEKYAFVKDIYGLNDEYTGTDNNHLSTPSQQSTVQRYTNTFIAPNNTSLDAFLQLHYGMHYSTIPDSIPDLQMEVILDGLIFESKNYFPTTFANGDALGPGAIPLPYDMYNDAEIKVYASNGPFYGVKNFITPAEYTAVTREIITNPEYISFLAALRKSNLFDILISDGSSTRFTLIAVPNEVFEDEGIYYIEDQDKFIGADSSNIGNGVLKNMMENHIFLGELDFNNDFWKFNTNLQGTVVKEQLNDIQGSGNLSSLNITRDVIPESNGYFYEANGFLAGTSDKVIDILSSYPPFSSFHDSLVSLDLIINDRLFVKKTPFTMFILDNTMMAAEEAAGVFPEDREERKSYFQSYFLEDALYHDAESGGLYTSYAKDSAYNSIELNITNTKTEFSVTDIAGNVVAVDSTLQDYIRQDGVIHKLKAGMRVE